MAYRFHVSIRSAARATRGRKLGGGQGAQAGVLHIDGKGQLERFAPESCFEGGQLLLRLPLRDRTGVVIAAHRDAPRRARGIVALEAGST